jgi:hypothetical protein
MCYVRARMYMDAGLGHEVNGVYGGVASVSGPRKWKTGQEKVHVKSAALST